VNRVAGGVVAPVDDEDRARVLVGAWGSVACVRVIAHVGSRARS
jgi:hypothetical protein